MILWSCYNCQQSCIPALVSNKEEFIVPVPCGPPGSPTSLWISRVGKYPTDPFSFTFNLEAWCTGPIGRFTCINLLLLCIFLQTMSAILFLPTYNNLQTNGCLGLLRRRPVVHTNRCKDHWIWISLVPFLLFSLGIFQIFQN